jgi:hypothetical protein
MRLVNCSKAPSNIQAASVNLLQVQLIAGMLALALAVLLLRRPRDTWQALLRFLLEPSSPFNPALLRVVTFGLILKAARATQAVWFAGFPHELLRLPPGWQWLDGLLPLDPHVVHAAQLALIATSGCAVAGLLTRVSAPLAALLAIYVLGVPNFYMKIDHGYHAVVMFACMLACAPCADVLSLDALWRRMRGIAAPAAGAEYTLPTRFCWLILGTVYLFPGFWKLWEGGDLWISGEKLQTELYLKWGQMPHFAPPARIDQSPVLLAMLGTSTLIFEIGFFFALFHRASRVIAAFSAVAFHLGIKYFMGIRFHVYLPLIALLDFPQLWKPVAARLSAALTAPVERLFAPRTGTAAPTRSVRPAAVVGSFFLAAQFITGFAAIDTWPVAVHPTFAVRREQPPAEISSTEIVLLPARGTKFVNLNDALQRIGSARLTRLLQELKKVSRDQRSLDQRGRTIVALFDTCNVHVAPGDAIEVYKTRWDLFPLGERTNYRRKLTDRYVVTENASLAPAR